MSQTPLMLAAMHGKIACVEILIEAGANVSKFLIPLSLSPLFLFFPSMLCGYLRGNTHEMKLLRLRLKIASDFDV